MKHLCLHLFQNLKTISENLVLEQWNSLEIGTNEAWLAEIGIKEEASFRWGHGGGGRGRGLEQLRLTLCDHVNDTKETFRTRMERLWRDEYMSEGEINNWVINESNDNSTEDQDYDIVTGGQEYGQGLVTYGDGEYDLRDNLLDCPEAKHDNKQASDLVKELVIRFDKSPNLTPSGTVTNRKLRARKLISLSQLCSSRCLVVGFVMKGASNKVKAKQVKWTDLHAPCRGWECSSDTRIQTAVSKAIHNHGSRQQATKAPPGLSPTTLRRLRGGTSPLVSRTRQWHRGKPRTAEVFYS